MNFCVNIAANQPIRMTGTQNPHLTQDDAPPQLMAQFVTIQLRKDTEHVDPSQAARLNKVVGITCRIDVGGNAAHAIGAGHVPSTPVGDPRQCRMRGDQNRTARALRFRKHVDLLAAISGQTR